MPRDVGEESKEMILGGNSRIWMYIQSVSMYGEVYYKENRFDIM